MKAPILSVSLCVFILLSSFTDIPAPQNQPATITKTTIVLDGTEVERIVIALDKNTSRELVIQTCTYLAKENVQLTFDKLTIGRRVFGKNRILFAEGNIALPNGTAEHFKAGGLTGVKSLKIQYTKNPTAIKSHIEMIEIID